MFKYDIVLAEDEDTGYSLRATESGFYIAHPSKLDEIEEVDSLFGVVFEYFGLINNTEGIVKLIAASGPMLPYDPSTLFPEVTEG